MKIVSLIIWTVIGFIIETYLLGHIAVYLFAYQAYLVEHMSFWGYIGMGLALANFPIPIIMMAAWYLPIYAPLIITLTKMAENQQKDNGYVD